MLDDDGICDNENITNEYFNNRKESLDKKYINKYPVAKSFLNTTLNQELGNILRLNPDRNAKVQSSSHKTGSGSVKIVLIIHTRIIMKKQFVL